MGKEGLGTQGPGPLLGRQVGDQCPKGGLMPGLILWRLCLFGTAWTSVGSIQAPFSGAAPVAPCVPLRDPPGGPPARL